MYLLVKENVSIDAEQDEQDKREKATNLHGLQRPQWSDPSFGKLREMVAFKVAEGRPKRYLEAAFVLRNRETGNIQKEKAHAGSACLQV